MAVRKLPLQAFFDQTCEGFFDSHVVSCACFYVLQAAFFFSPGFDFFFFDEHFVSEVGFVANYQKWELFFIDGVSVGKESVSPGVQMLVTLPVTSAEHDCASVCSPVEGNSKRLEPFFPCSVPDLGSYFPAVNFDLPVGEFSSNGGLEFLQELGSDVPVDERGLAHPRVANHDYLQKYLFALLVFLH